MSAHKAHTVGLYIITYTTICFNLYTTKVLKCCGVAVGYVPDYSMYW